MKPIIFLLMILCMNIPGWTADPSDLRISAGAEMLVLQSAYSFQQSTGITAAVRGDWIGNLDWQLGARVGLDPAGFEAFKRLLAAPQLGIWQPLAGFELGLTGRTDFESGNYLLMVGNQQSADLARQMTAQGNNNGLANLVGLVAPGDGAFFLSSAFMRSDHGLLWYRDIPALLLTDTANFRNPHYHLSTDTPETLNPEFLAQNTRSIRSGPPGCGWRRCGFEKTAFMRLYWNVDTAWGPITGLNWS
ncbi:MAG: hypothetical protein U5R06_15735 [candidate division KSB1 bacterium]|nr:hypothetical protein [candidate division KSB1 bacterium]